MPPVSTPLTTGSSCTTPTSFQYTGQRIEQSLGIYYYGARWYDPQLGRFLQADTIVPGGVQGLDRYAYVFNNPLKYTDPSGHGRESTDCGPDGIYCDNDKSNDYDYTIMPQLDLGDVPDPENRNKPTNSYPEGFIVPAWENYKKIWQWLMDSVVYRWAIDPRTGMIKDTALMALIISGEFGGLKGESIYHEALGALSNEYHAVYGENGNYSNIQCGSNGPGCSLGEQIAWLSDVQSLYSGLTLNVLENGSIDFTDYYEDASRAYYGINSDKWMWANTDDYNKYPGAVYRWFPASMGGYPGKPWFVVYP